LRVQLDQKVPLEQLALLDLKVLQALLLVLLEQLVLGVQQVHRDQLELHQLFRDQRVLLEHLALLVELDQQVLQEPLLQLLVLQVQQVL
jgi:hypothetical protein